MEKWELQWEQGEWTYFKDLQPSRQISDKHLRFGLKGRIALAKEQQLFWHFSVRQHDSGLFAQYRKPDQIGLGMRTVKLKFKTKKFKSRNTQVKLHGVTVMCPMSTALQKPEQPLDVLPQSSRRGQRSVGLPEVSRSSTVLQSRQLQGKGCVGPAWLQLPALPATEPGPQQMPRAQTTMDSKREELLWHLLFSAFLHSLLPFLVKSLHI